MGDDTWSAMELRSFLFDRVYHAPEVLVEVQRAHHVVLGYLTIILPVLMSA